MESLLSVVLLDTASWWDAKPVLEQVYWGISIIGSLILTVIMILTFAGGDGDFSSDPDLEIESDAGAGFQFFTLKNLVGFFTIFGWAGLACIDLGVPFIVTIIVSIFCGLVMMFMMAGIFYLMSRMVESGTLSLKNAIGATGEVYLPIPANRGGLGKIQIKVQGALRELDAMTKEGVDIPRGALVEVHEIVNDHILLVTKQS